MFTTRERLNEADSNNFSDLFSIYLKTIDHSNLVVNDLLAYWKFKKLNF